MSTGTGISYLDSTWNPTSGCSHSGSPGCDNCWAKRMATRLRGRFGYPADNPFKPTRHPDRLDIPLHWKKPRRIGVSFMGDLFNKNIPFTFIPNIWKIICKCPQHTFLILTKRPVRMRDFLREYKYLRMPENIHIGVSVENQQTADERIPVLLQIPAAVHWVSVEPMLGPVDLGKFLTSMCKICTNTGFFKQEIHAGGFGQYEKTTEMPCPDCGAKPTIEPPSVDWVVCGAETGPGARPMHPEWPRRVRDDCVAAGVPFWFKSWGEWAGYEIYEDMDHIQAINISYIDKEGKTYEKYHEILGIKGVAYIARVGKKESGNRLDGKIWEQLP